MPQDHAQRILNRRYHLEKLLGEGAMGSVHLARDGLRRNRPVALKLLAPGTTHTGSRQRLCLEFQTLSRLRHPNLVQVFDLGVDRETGRWFLTMEYVAGQALSRWEPVVPADLLRLAVPLLGALDYIHARRIVHADIKPANILLPVDGGQPKIADFGLAGLLDQPGTLRGTLPYTAPEVLRGDAPGKASDFYSLGATLYGVAAGHGPFDAPTPEQIIEGHLSKEPPFPAEMVNRLPPGMAVLLRRLLAKNPAERPSSGAAVISALGDMAGHSISSQIAGSGKTSVTWGPLLGRQREMETLQTQLGQVYQSRRGSLCLLTGAAGMGKSRLVAELRTLAQMESLDVVLGRCQPGSDTPYDAIQTAVQHLLTLTGSPPSPLLRSFLSDRPEKGQEKTWDRTRLFESITDLLRDCATGNPLVLVLEDIHASGPDQIALISHLLRGIRQAPVMCVITGRQSVENVSFTRFLKTASSDLNGIPMELSPLSQEDAERLVPALLTGEAVHSQDFVSLAKDSGGNPYLLAEMVQASVDCGALTRGRDGRWKMNAQELSQHPLPASLEEAVGCQLSALTKGQRDLLDLLSIKAAAMERESFLKLTGQSSATLAFNLQQLLERELVVSPDLTGDDHLFTLPHPFIREVVLKSLRESRPRRLVEIHQALAAELLSLGDSALDEKAAELARHKEGSGQLEEAGRLHLRAADHEEGRFALATAAHHLEQALVLLKSSLTSPLEEVEILEKLGDIHRLGLRPEDAEAALKQALQRIPEEGNTALQARLLRKSALMKTLRGQHEAARRLAVQAKNLYGRIRHLEGEADCENILGISFARVGEHLQAEVHYRQALALRHQGGRSEHLWPGLQNLGMVLFFMGRWKEGRGLLEEALQIARTRKNPHGVSLIINNLGLLAREEGHLMEARELLQEAEAAHREHGSLPWRGESLLILAEVELRRGAFDEAVQLAGQAAELYSRLGMHAKMAHAQEILGAAYRQSGQMEPALEHHARGLSLAQRAGDAVQEGFALCALAQDHLATGDAASATACLDSAPSLKTLPAGSRLGLKLGQARAAGALVSGQPDRALREIEQLVSRGKQGWSFHEDLETRLLQARALLTQGDFITAREQLEDLQAQEELIPCLAHHWNVLRLLAQCLAGLGLEQPATEMRRKAVQAWNRNAALLAPPFRQSLERLPAAVRLRIDSGGSDTARISPVRFLNTMYSVLEVLTAVSRIDKMLEEVTDLAIELLGAERGMILLFPEDGSGPNVKVARRLEEKTIADAISYSCRIVQEGRAGAALIAADAALDPRLKEFASIALYHIRSVLCVPMRTGQRIIGTIYLDSRENSIGFDAEDLRFLQALAQHCAIALENAAMMRAMEKENIILRKTLLERYSFANIVGRSGAMREIFAGLKSFTSTPLPVLVRGESGTGKELVARALHYNGARKEKPFLVENCAALPEPLLESQLFGHVRGAFTGASSEAKGLFQEADGGTLFLDEVGEMSAALQARLTRVLENGEFRPLGGSRTLKCDVRVVAATHRDLEAMVQAGLFRQDLLYRLNIITIDLPPLRRRREDIPLLISHFLRELSAEMECEVPGMEDRAMELLSGQPWPGNVRQLKNEISRLLVFRRGNVITADEVRDLGLAPPEASPPPPSTPDESISLKELERRHILSALQETSGDRAQAARLLKVGRATIFRKIKEYHLDD